MLARGSFFGGEEKKQKILFLDIIDGHGMTTIDDNNDLDPTRRGILHLLRKFKDGKTNC